MTIRISKLGNLTAVCETNINKNWVATKPTLVDRLLNGVL